MLTLKSKYGELNDEQKQLRAVLEKLARQIAKRKRPYGLVSHVGVNGGSSAPVQVTFYKQQMQGMVAQPITLFISWQELEDEMWSNKNV